MDQMRLVVFRSSWILDAFRNGVKQAKTAEKIKNKAILYEQAVISFDLQAEKVVDLLEKLPGIKQEHQASSVGR